MTAPRTLVLDDQTLAQCAGDFPSAILLIYLRTCAPDAEGWVTMSGTAFGAGCFHVISHNTISSALRWLAAHQFVEARFMPGRQIKQYRLTARGQARKG